MRFTNLTSLLVVSGLSLASCVNSRPIHYYTVGTSTAPMTKVNPDGPVLLVGNVATPVSLQDGRIRYLTGSYEAGAYEFHRWLEQPGVMVRNSLLQSLRASGQFRTVLESSSSAQGDYVLRGSLHEFGEVDRETIQTRISLQLELVDVKTKRDVWDRLVQHDEPVAGRKIRDVVQSFDRNLQEVVKEVTLETGKFLSAASQR